MAAEGRAGRGAGNAPDAAPILPWQIEAAGEGEGALGVGAEAVEGGRRGGEGQAAESSADCEGGVAHGGIDAGGVEGCREVCGSGGDGGTPGAVAEGAVEDAEGEGGGGEAVATVEGGRDLPVEALPVEDGALVGAGRRRPGRGRGVAAGDVSRCRSPVRRRCGRCAGRSPTPCRGRLRWVRRFRWQGCRCRGR